MSRSINNNHLHCPCLLKLSLKDHDCVHSRSRRHLNVTIFTLFISARKRSQFDNEKLVVHVNLMTAMLIAYCLTLISEAATQSRVCKSQHDGTSRVQFTLQEINPLWLFNFKRSIFITPYGDLINYFSCICMLAIIML